MATQDHARLDDPAAKRLLEALAPATATIAAYDFIVVGSGPSGRRAAIQAAKLGKRVLVVEKGRRVGGVSVHTGTIPSKTLRETVLNLSGWRERGFYGRAFRAKKDITAGDLDGPPAHDPRSRGRHAGTPVRPQRRGTSQRHGDIPRPAPHLGHGRERRDADLRGREVPDRRRHPPAPAEGRAVRRRPGAGQRRDHRPQASAAQPHGDRRRRHRRRVRDHLQRARRRRDAGRAALDLPGFRRPRAGRRFPASAPRPRHDHSLRLQGRTHRDGTRSSGHDPGQRAAGALGDAAVSPPGAWASPTR